MLYYLSPMKTFVPDYFRIMEWIDAMSCLPILNGFDISTISLGCPDDTKTFCVKRPFDELK